VWAQITSHNVQNNGDPEAIDVFSFVVPETGTYSLESDFSKDLNALFSEYVGGEEDDSSLVGWLKKNRLEFATEALIEAGAEEPNDLLELGEDDIADLGLKTLQRKKLQKAIIELSAPPPEVIVEEVDLLLEWLKEHKLEFAEAALKQRGAKAPSDLLELGEDGIADLGLKTLQRKKLTKYVNELIALAPPKPKEDPLLEWLKGNKLEVITAPLMSGGVSKLVDLLKLGDNDIASFGLTSLQRRKLAKECRLERGRRGELSSADKEKMQSEAKAKIEAEENAKKEAEEQAKIEAEEKAKQEAEEKAKKEAEEQATKEAEAKKEAEEKAKKEAEAKAEKEAEEKVKKEAEEKVKKEAEEKAKKEAEEKEKKEAEEKEKKEAEEKEKEAEEKAKQEAIEKEKKEAEEKAKQELEEKAKKEAEKEAEKKEKKGLKWDDEKEKDAAALEKERLQKSKAKEKDSAFGMKLAAAKIQRLVPALMGDMAKLIANMQKIEVDMDALVVKHLLVRDDILSKIDSARNLLELQKEKKAKEDRQTNDYIAKLTHNFKDLNVGVDISTMPTELEWIQLVDEGSEAANVELSAHFQVVGAPVDKRQLHKSFTDLLELYETIALNQDDLTSMTNAVKREEKVKHHDFPPALDHKMKDWLLRTWRCVKSVRSSLACCTLYLI
jgi:chemotaxis protein histidine kinase CheA